MGLEDLIAALEGQNWKDARWHAEAQLHLRGVYKVRSSKHSTETMIQPSAADLRTLLDTLLETLISTDQSTESTSRSKLKSLVKSLPSSKSTGSGSGQEAEQPAAGSPAKRKRLPSKRQYWPVEAKDVFWSLVKRLNEYDKKHSPGGRKSPIQLAVAEEATRRWWRMEYGQNS